MCLEISMERGMTFLDHRDKVYGGGFMLYSRRHCQRPDLVKVVRTGPASKLMSYLQQTGMMHLDLPINLKDLDAESGS